MSQETELDDLDLDKLLDDEDFLEDFDLDEVVSDSESQAAPDSPLDAETTGLSEPPTTEPMSSADNSTTTVDSGLLTTRSLRQKIIFPIAVFLVVLMLALQIYAAGKIFFPEIHIASKSRKIAVAEVVSHDLSAVNKKASKAEIPSKDIVTFNFHYPLYSLSGLKILGVEVQLVFPPQGSLHLEVEQIARLKATMHDSLDRAVAGRMLEELGNYDDFFTESLQESLLSTLKQWHLPPATIRLENLVVH